jgi:hypothetical protein
MNPFDAVIALAAVVAMDRDRFRQRLQPSIDQMPGNGPESPTLICGLRAPALRATMIP